MSQNIFKCKMCAGQIGIDDITAGFGTCPYCGTLQTFPRITDEKRRNLYERADDLRRNAEYDKAIAVLDEILDADKEDAECYFRHVLCEYGVDYVEDKGKRVPTINRMQYKSVYSDENYKAAVKYADATCARIYENEIKQLADIQKKVLEIIGKEEPYDIFISYKSKNPDGSRTPDSVFANDIYHQLVQEGFRVFFAEISLENKLGKDYEPYIFAALNSAKVMLAITTSAENINSVWVRNEWQRFMKYLDDAEERMLIPCIKDMDQYDLPEEFAHLQIMDMGNMGFFSELLRGIQKICGRGSTNTNVSLNTLCSKLYETGVVENIVKRAAMDLEDEEWTLAEEHYKRALLGDKECKEASKGLFLAKHRAKDMESVIDKTAQHVIMLAEKKGTVYEIMKEEFEQKKIEWEIPYYFTDGEITDLLIPGTLYRQVSEKNIDSATDKIFASDLWVNFFKIFPDESENIKEDVNRKTRDILSEQGYDDEAVNTELKKAFDYKVMRIEETRKDALEKRKYEFYKANKLKKSMLRFKVKKAVQMYLKVQDEENAAKATNKASKLVVFYMSTALPILYLFIMLLTKGGFHNPAYANQATWIGTAVLVVISVIMGIIAYF